MERYIDADAVEKQIDDYYDAQLQSFPSSRGKEKQLLLGGINYGRNVVRDAPTADVVEVVHGEWIYHECVSSYDGAISGYSCSKCCSFVDEEIFDADRFHKEFCGHCGAKMGGERSKK